MSDNIPFEIQMEIIQRIPDIKSVIQFRSISKAWKSIIDSKEFVTTHTLRHIQQQPRHLVIRREDFVDSQEEVKYVSIVDDDTFPHQKFNLSVPDICKNTRLVGSSHGLFCLYDYERKMFVIWNPSIRKTVLTTVVPYESYTTYVGFGVCHNTLDPKLVKIPYDKRMENPSAPVEVFTLSFGVWRSPLSNTSPRKSILFGWSHSHVVVDGFIYWDAWNRIEVDGGYICHTLIVSFNLTSEEFTDFDFPNSHRCDLSLSNLRGSLGVFEYCYPGFNPCVNVWIMKGCGCTRSFERLYHISPLISLPLGFRWSGALIVEMGNDQRDSPVALSVYEPESKDITEIWRVGRKGAFCVRSYVETLLLLDH